MLGQFRQARGQYPRQFWWLLWGSLLSSTGSALIWPFMSIYLRQRLGVPLATVAGLMTLSSAMGLVASFIAGPLTDRVGRKGGMVFSLATAAIYYLLMTQARTLPMYAVLIGASGAVWPLYPVGANAMIADLIPQERRTDAYALLRVVHNVGVAIGPILGGLLTSISYTTAFYVAAAAYALFTMLVLVAMRETLPRREGAEAARGGKAGWGPVLRDRLFLAFVGSFAVTNMVTAIMFMLLPVYAKEQFALPESRYGFIVTVNALMCIFMQYSVTQVTKRHPPLPVLVVGALFYAVGVGSVALGNGLWAFIASMVVMTMGESIMTPTAVALAAEMAPLEMRGRYMGIYNLTWGIGSGIGPVVGGFLNDNVGPRAIWAGGLCFGLLSALGFSLLVRPFRASRRILLTKAGAAGEGIPSPADQ